MLHSCDVKVKLKKPIPKIAYSEKINKKTFKISFNEWASNKKLLYLYSIMSSRWKRSSNKKIKVILRMWSIIKSHVVPALIEILHYASSSIKQFLIYIFWIRLLLLPLMSSAEIFKYFYYSGPSLLNEDVIHWQINGSVMSLDFNIVFKMGNRLFNGFTAALLIILYVMVINLWQNYYVASECEGEKKRNWIG